MSKEFEEEMLKDPEIKREHEAMKPKYDRVEKELEKTNWRPDNWESISPDPCKDCTRKEEDAWGLLCEWTCRELDRYLNREAGADMILGALWKLAKESPTGIFTIDSRTINVFSDEEIRDEKTDV